MAQIGLLHHLGGCDADLPAVGTIFREDLLNQIVFFGHRDIHPKLKIILKQSLSEKQKETPAEGRGSQSST